MASVFSELIIDCRDPYRLAAFWSEVLGYRVTEEAPEDVEISGGPGVRPTLLFAKVPEQKTVKNRLHIDLSPIGADQADEVERIVALGATRVDIGQGDVSWVVLADPEGNEFCILRSRLDERPAPSTGAGEARPSDADRPLTDDERVDEASMDSYPASDPPAW